MKSSVVTELGDSVLAVICHGWNHLEFLVQCNDDEESYCFPSGSIKFGENSYQAIGREIQEQYGFEIKNYGLLMLHENMKEQPERCVSFLHWCTIKSCSLTTTISHRFSEFQHREYKKTKLVWCSETDLYEKSIYPRDMLESLVATLYTEDGTFKMVHWLSR